MSPLSPQHGGRGADGGRLSPRLPGRLLQPPSPRHRRRPLPLPQVRPGHPLVPSCVTSPVPCPLSVSPPGYRPQSVLPPGARLGGTWGCPCGDGGTRSCLVPSGPFVSPTLSPHPWDPLVPILCSFMSPTLSPSPWDPPVPIPCPFVSPTLSLSPQNPPVPISCVPLCRPPPAVPFPMSPPVLVPSLLSPRHEGDTEPSPGSGDNRSFFRLLLTFFIESEVTPWGHPGDSLGAPRDTQGHPGDT